MTKEQNEFQCVISDDKTSFTLTLPDGQKLELKSANDLSIVLSMLGHIRQQLQPSVPVSPNPNYHHFAYLDYLQMLPQSEQIPPVQGGAVFLAQSPAFGWFQFPASPEFCRGLVSWLNGSISEISAPSDAVLN